MSEALRGLFAGLRTAAGSVEDFSTEDVDALQSLIGFHGVVGCQALETVLAVAHERGDAVAPVALAAFALQETAEALRGRGEVLRREEDVLALLTLMATAQYTDWSELRVYERAILDAQAVTGPLRTAERAAFEEEHDPPLFAQIAFTCLRQAAA